MRLFRPLLLAAAVCLPVAPAAAQITPEEVWVLWQGLSQGTGQTVTAQAQRRDGPRLVLDGVQVVSRSATSVMTLPLGQVVLADRGDGSVQVVLPAAFAVDIALDEPDADPVALTVAVAQDNPVAIVTGTAAATRWAYSASAMSVSLTGAAVDGQAMPMDMGVTFRGLAGSSDMAAAGPGAPMALRYDLTAEGMDLVMAADNPEGDGTFELSIGAQALSSRFEGALPASMAPDMPLGAAMAAGLRGDGASGTGPVEFALDLDDKGKVMSAVGGLASTALEVGLGPAGLRYQVGATGMAVTVSGSDLPMPELTVTAAEYTTGITMPVVAAPVPGDFGLVLRLVDLALPPEIWEMLDPGGALPRDPATLVLDARGKATLFRDLTDATAPGDAAPGQIDAVTVDALQLRAGGAELTGRAEFSFDNADMQTFGGFPRPTGVADLMLTGGNALLDRLVAAGLMGPDEVMGIRLGMAMFARPGVEPDTLTSRIEITPDAQVLANGQRIQ
jgi:hypothetical protein